MAGILHGSARTTWRVRAELQASQASTRALAAQYGLNPKTVAKWRPPKTTIDAPMGPRQPHSTVLTPAEEAIVVEFRRRTLLPLADVLGCLRATVPNLTRSALHRCLQCHNISRLPEREEKASKRGAFRRDDDRLCPYRRLQTACTTPTANCTCSSPSTESRSAPMSNSMNAPTHYDGPSLPAQCRGRVPLENPHGADDNGVQRPFPHRDSVEFISCDQRHGRAC
jgi:hypothetical protein